MLSAATRQKFSAYEAAGWRRTFPAERLSYFCWRCKEVLGLSRAEAAILSMLVAGVETTGALLASYAKALSCGYTQDKTLKVQMCRVRRALSAVGVSVETLRGIGYRLSAENRDKVLAILGMGVMADA
jgi:DNA-binding response OmpR family regulator